MPDTFVLQVESDAREELVAELGSMNAFYDRLFSLVERETLGGATMTESTDLSTQGHGTRGGDLIEIMTATTGLISSLAPIIITWIRARGLEVEERTEIQDTGAVVHSIRVKRGSL